jgi:hypothetical protein
MAATLKTTDAYVVANVKHYELCLPKVGFFSWLQNYRPHPRELELAKVG